tara:strand:+ start:4248 stop:4562 length:315 start_codon:yes stop_codon:yes gene_type:complete
MELIPSYYHREWLVRYNKRNIAIMQSSGGVNPYQQELVLKLWENSFTSEELIELAGLLNTKNKELGFTNNLDPNPFCHLSGGVMCTCSELPCCLIRLSPQKKIK